MKPALDAVREETSREIFNGAKDFVAFALATGGDLRLLATACPCVTQGAPLGKAGLIFKQEQPLAPLRRPYNRRPLLLQPGEALRCIEMIRHKPSLLKRSEEHTSELQSPCNLVCRLLLEKKKNLTVSHARLSPADAARQLVS